VVYTHNEEGPRPSLGTNVMKCLRIPARIGMALLWTMLGALAITCVWPLQFVACDRAHALRRRIARLWVRGVPRILGTRIIVKGTAPKAPFYLIGNHICWIDFFLTQTVVDAVVVTDKVVDAAPVLGAIFRALDIIVIGRCRMEVCDVNQKITDAMLAGKSIVMAPEATVSLGRRVYPFHSPLLEPAVRLNLPVHYASLTVRTPEGCLPASRAVVKPDPEHPLPDVEMGNWGAPDRSFGGYLVDLLGLPYHEYTIHFGEHPIAGTNRKALAKDLQYAVEAIFTPVA